MIATNIDLIRHLEDRLKSAGQLERELIIRLLEIQYQEIMDNRRQYQSALISRYQFHCITYEEWQCHTDAFTRWERKLYPRHDGFTAGNIISRAYYLYLHINTN